MSSLRWTLAMLLAASCTRPAVPTEPPASVRPPGTSNGRPVAAVLFVEGAPTIGVGERSLEARLDLELDENDVVRTPAKSWLVLRILANGYVVKVDEELELPVKELALLDAPPARESIDQQLRALQAAQEIDADRVTAYQSRRVAAVAAPRMKSERAKETRQAAAEGARAPSPAPASEDKKGASLEREAAEPASAAPAPARGGVDLADTQKRAPAGPAKDRLEVQQRKALAEDLKAAEPSAGGAIKAKEPDDEEAPAAVPPREVGGTKVAKADDPGTAQAEAVASSSWERVVAGKAEPQAGPLPPAIAKALGDLATTRSCVKAAWAAKGLATAGGADQLLLRVEGGKVVKVKLGSGLPAGECASAAMGIEAGFERGWIRIKVALE